MRFDTSDPDIATIVRRIERNVIDLQPDFQRGEVWSASKKQRLIDSILRKWHVPPIHLVAKSGGKYDVLDGQQRLTAIRDFVRGKFAIDGDIEPIDSRLVELDGLRYFDLPEDTKDEFDAFSVRVFALSNYTPEEPYELFFRLNQPTSLTEAEKRNAFVGGPRNQVKDLVLWAESVGMQSRRIGFSNARMAYDDLLARLLLTLEQRTLMEKVTAAKITARYRTAETFSSEIMGVARAALQFVLGLPFLEGGVRPNKATLHTWFCMAARLQFNGDLPKVADELADFILWLEGSRASSRSLLDEGEGRDLVLVFDDRATSRVADVTSVLLRDLTAWMLFTARADGRARELPYLGHIARTESSESNAETVDERLLYDYAVTSDWGRLA